MAYYIAPSGITALFELPLFILGGITRITDWTKWNQRYAGLNAIESLSQLADAFYPEILQHRYRKLAAQIRRIDEHVMPGLNGLGLIGSVVRTINLVDKRFNFIPPNLIRWSNLTVLAGSYPLLLGCSTILGSMGLFYTTYKTTLALNEYFWPKNRGVEAIQDKAYELVHGQLQEVDLKNQADQKIFATTKAAYERPQGREIVREVFLISRIFLNFITFCVCPSPLLLLNLVLESACLYQLTKRRWINYAFTYEKRKIPFEDFPNSTALQKPTLHLLTRIETPRRIGPGDCAICLEEMGKQTDEPDGKEREELPIPNLEAIEENQRKDVVLPCSNGHLIHLQCMSRWVTRSQSIIELQQNWACSCRRQEERQTHRITKSYKIIIQRNNLPTCPACRATDNWTLEGSALEMPAGQHLNVEIVAQ